MAITVATMLKVLPGKEKEVLERLKTVKKIVERAGGTYAVRRQVAGPQPNHIAAVAQYPDWSHLGKVRSDPELQKLADQLRSSSDPAAEALTSAIFEDVAI
ncbi:MAG: hypothetical protein ACLQAT_11560 [Candidatus Binataceae bacterium]